MPIALNSPRAARRGDSRPCRLPITSAFLVAGALTIGATGGVAADIAGSPPWLVERNDAVNRARQGDPAAALEVLERLRREHPGEVGVTRDVVVVSAWAGRDAAVIQLFEAMPPGPQPDFLIEPVALAYRHLNRSAEALALYRRGLAQSPGNGVFTAGAIRSLVGLGQLPQAIAEAEADLAARGARVPVLLAAGYATSALKKPIETLRYTDRALIVAPGDREATHDRIMAIDEMGAPQVARRLSLANPEALSAAEQRAVDGDAAAALVRWGVFEPPDEARRFAASDRAIAALDLLIARWSTEGEAATRDILRARFDRMVALRDRARMADVLIEYEDMVGRKIEVPGYALVAAADAYLYLRQPEKARDLYVRGLEVDPRNPETRLALFYAYVDLDDFDAAYRQVDAAAADQAIWLYLKGLTDPIENGERATADLTAANARVFADQLAEAHRRIGALAEAAPNNSRYRTALANVESARGWPRLAADEYEISRALKPLGVTTEVGQARNNLLLRDYRLVERQLADLKARFPENLELRALDRQWQIHNMAEFRLTVEAGLGSSTTAKGGPGIAVEAQLYSPPIDFNWRLFASEYEAHEKLNPAEGAVTLRRSAFGGEYRDRDLVASLEATLSAYGPSNLALRGGATEGRVGARALAAWSLNDYWQIGGGAEIFARDTPIRALRNGITANAGMVNVTFRESESSEFALTGTVMDFSDGNLRAGFDAKHTRRLITEPRFTLDGILGLAGSRNSADANRPYYNPREDLMASVGLSATQPIYRRYEFVYDHHLVVTPGLYAERGYGANGVINVLYEHRVRANDVIEAGLGLDFDRQTYDGVYQNTVTILFNLRARF